MNSNMYMYANSPGLSGNLPDTVQTKSLGFPHGSPNLRDPFRKMLFLADFWPFSKATFWSDWCIFVAESEKLCMSI